MAARGIRHVIGFLVAMAIGGGALLGGCSSDPGSSSTSAGPGGPRPPTVLPTPQQLTVRRVEWNGEKAALGKVMAVAEMENELAVFSDTGMSLLAAGVVVANDPSVKSWQGAAVIPAADGNGSWVVGVDGDGHVRRIKARRSLEDVSDRYGLAKEKVRAVAPMGGSMVAFAYDGGVAIADGKSVTPFKDDQFKNLAAAKGRVASAGPQGVRVIDMVAGKIFSFPLAGATQVVFDAKAKMVVTSPKALYVENERGDLQVVHESPEGDLHGLATAGNRVWFGAGTELGTLENGALARTNGASMAPDAQLIGSPSGDIWAIVGGALTRWLADTGVGPQAQAWDEKVRPSFTRACSKCHLPGGTAGVDLSTYGAWVERRALIRQRVLVAKNMPPAGNPLSPEDRDAIRAWIEQP